MDRTLLIGGIVVMVILLCSRRWAGSCARSNYNRRLPKVQYVVLGGKKQPDATPAKPSHVEGSLGPTPYREDGIRAPGPTEHYNNKTNVLWMASRSQADVDEETGVSQDAISSEYLTPLRMRGSARRPNGPRKGETMQSHV